VPVRIPPGKQRASGQPSGAAALTALSQPGVQKRVDMRIWPSQAIHGTWSVPGAGASLDFWLVNIPRWHLQLTPLHTIDTTRGTSSRH